LKIQNLINSLQRKQKDYDILKLNYENLHEKISIYEHKNQVFLKVFQEGFNRITEKKDSISKSTEKSMIDPLNRLLESIGLQTLNRNLIYSTSLF
jgi:hypothetical protein